MTFILVLNGAIGSRTEPSSIVAPEPFAYQFGKLTPQAMNKAAKRFGTGAGNPAVTEVAPHTGMDSSHGRVIVTPMPRRNARRVSWWRRKAGEFSRESGWFIIRGRYLRLDGRRLVVRSGRARPACSETAGC